MASARTVDVTVMGAGIFGLSIAWECIRRGARVRLVERDRIGAGASGGIVGALAPHVPENWNAKKEFQLESLLMAEAFWTDVGAAAGQDPGYARTGRVQPVADAGMLALAEARIAGAEALWRGRAVWRIEPVAGSGWDLRSGTGLMIRDTLSALLHPRRAAAALAAAIAARGGEIVLGHAAPEAMVIWATGVAGLADLSQSLMRPLGGAVKGQAALFAQDARDLPQVFAEGVHIVPHGDGTVAVGSTSERTYEAPDTVDAQLETLIAQARRICPALAGAPVIERWAGLRPRARSRAPMLGPWPGRPGHFIANGGFKIGFGMAPGIAGMMADLVLEGQDAIPGGFRVEDSF